MSIQKTWNKKRICFSINFTNKQTNKITYIITTPLVRRAREFLIFIENRRTRLLVAICLHRGDYMETNKHSYLEKLIQWEDEVKGTFQQPAIPQKSFLNV